LFDFDDIPLLLFLLVSVRERFNRVELEVHIQVDVLEEGVIELHAEEGGPAERLDGDYEVEQVNVELEVDRHTHEGEEGHHICGDTGDQGEEAQHDEDLFRP